MCVCVRVSVCPFTCLKDSVSVTADCAKQMMFLTFVKIKK